MVSDTKVALTYESLYEISLREKQREALQPLDLQFWRQALFYLREKQAMLEDSRKKVDIFSATERENVSQQIRNIKRILHEIYNRREKKILDIALNKSRTGSKIIDTSNMLDVERQFFESIVNEMNLFRQGLLNNILELLEPSMWLEEREEEGKEEGKEEEEEEGTTGGLNGEHVESRVLKDASISEGMAAIQAIQDIAQFIGKELETYGPFKTGELIILPADLAQILIRNGDATPRATPSGETTISSVKSQIESHVESQPDFEHEEQEESNSAQVIAQE